MTRYEEIKFTRLRNHGCIQQQRSHRSERDALKKKEKKKEFLCYPIL